MYWSCFCVCSEQATLHIYIQWSYFVFFEAIIYLRESTNRAISYTRWWNGYGLMSFAHIFLSWRCTIQLCLSFSFFVWYKKKRTRIFIRHSPFTEYFFSLPFSFFSKHKSIFLFEWYRSNTSCKVPEIQKSSKFFFSFVYIWFDRAWKADHEYILFIWIRSLFGWEIR
jgi:hypothetical protein